MKDPVYELGKKADGMVVSFSSGDFSYGTLVTIGSDLYDANSGEENKKVGFVRDGVAYIFDELGEALPAGKVSPVQEKFPFPFRLSRHFLRESRRGRLRRG